MAIFARIGRLFRGFLGLFISGIESRNPEALMEAARQDFRDKMVQYNLALARMAGVAERLDRDRYSVFNQLLRGGKRVID